MNLSNIKKHARDAFCSFDTHNGVRSRQACNVEVAINRPRSLVSVAGETTGWLESKIVACKLASGVIIIQVLKKSKKDLT